jgi:hypothetical protein
LFGSVKISTDPLPHLVRFDSELASNCINEELRGNCFDAEFLRDRFDGEIPSRASTFVTEADWLLAHPPC